MIVIKFELSKEDADFLLKYAENAEKLIAEQNSGELFVELEYAILERGLDKDGFYNAFGRRAQEVHDNLLASIEEHREKNT